MTLQYISESVIGHGHTINLQFLSDSMRSTDQRHTQLSSTQLQRDLNLQKAAGAAHHT